MSVPEIDQKPEIKKRLPRRFLSNLPTVQKTQFCIGDLVYARYHGDDVLRIVGIADVSTSFPHYICEVYGSLYVIPKMHLSTRRISSETHSNNRLQLSLSI